MDIETDYRIALPTGGVAAMIDTGSGVVVVDDGSERLRVDFEGNRHGAGNLQRYADRVHHALGRSETDYPTVARLHVSRDQLRFVGTFDDVHGKVIIDADAVDAVAEWINSTDPDEMVTSGSLHNATRELAAAFVTDPHRAAIIARTGPSIYRRAAARLGR